ncbi:MAG: serine/threonine protein kinase [Sandaracinaceae bacterium]|nr:serine/threonine protein kinase [Sandaracinaceae bacterium]MBP7682590.1 serine/threonine protein kinase [Deltaproteobacteria bacterium]
MRLRRAPTQYKPVSRIAVGGMAEVWRGTATFEGGDEYPVAIKRVLPHITDPLFRAMFKDEARLGMTLRHPNIVPVYDARDIGGTYLMIMELVDGDSLKGLLDRAFEAARPMPEATALYIAQQLAAGIAYAHRAVDANGKPMNIIHRDVSPHNLLLGKNGVVKLTDFGLADAADNSALGEGMIGGKFGYLAPEIVRQEPHGQPVDVFALGVILWEMLAGRRLFHGRDDAETVRKVAACEVPPLPAVNPRVSGAVDELVRHTLQSQPVNRIPSAADFSDEALGLLARIDSEVGPKDVQLLMGLHSAMKARKVEARSAASLQEEMDVAQMLSGELDAFAAAQQGKTVELGAQPLDPNAFGIASLFGGGNVGPFTPKR